MPVTPSREYECNFVHQIGKCKPQESSRRNISLSVKSAIGGSSAESVSPPQARSLFTLSTAMLAAAAKAYGFSHIIPSVLSAYDKLRDEVSIVPPLLLLREETEASCQQQALSNYRMPLGRDLSSRCFALSLAFLHSFSDLATACNINRHSLTTLLPETRGLSSCSWKFCQNNIQHLMKQTRSPVHYLSRALNSLFQNTNLSNRRNPLLHLGQNLITRHTVSFSQR